MGPGFSTWCTKQCYLCPLDRWVLDLVRGALRNATYVHWIGSIKVLNGLPIKPEHNAILRFKGFQNV